MPICVNGQTYYRTVEVCRMTGISRNTLFSMTRNGYFSEPEKRDWRGWRLFTKAQVSQLITKTGTITEVIYK